MKIRHLYIGRLSNSVSTDDITKHCKKKGVDIQCIREISRDEPRLKSFHCVFKFENDVFKFVFSNLIRKLNLQISGPKMFHFHHFGFNQNAREWLASFDT